MDLVQYGYHTDSDHCVNCYDLVINEGLSNLRRNSYYSITSDHYVTDDGVQHHGDWYECCAHIN